MDLQMVAFDYAPLRRIARKAPRFLYYTITDILLVAVSAWILSRLIGHFFIY